MILVNHGLVRGGPKADHGREDDQKAEAPLLQRQAETAGVVQPEKEKASGRPPCSFPVLYGDLRN